MANATVKFHKETGTATVEGEDGEITLVGISSDQQERAICALLVGREVRSMKPEFHLRT